MTQSENELAPLRGLLDGILDRLENVEAKVGISPPPKAKGSSCGGEAGKTKSVTAYQEYIQKSVVPFVKSCDDLIELKDIGSEVLKAWEGIGYVIELASICKKPMSLSGNLSNVLTPYLKPTQEAVLKITKYRLNRDYDWHLKAIMEMMCCCSWVLITSPPPAKFLRESIGSSDFWSNKIRKQYKQKGESGKNHIVFCDLMKLLIQDLISYVKEYHLAGLQFNPQGASTLAEAETILNKKKESGKPDVKKEPGIADIMKELDSRKTSQGDSAATGLRKVKKEQQTWRKEYKGEATSPVKSTQPKSSPTKVTTTHKPVMEYVKHKHKWIVEYQTPEVVGPSKLIKMSIPDRKQQVYIYKCSGVTFQIENKLKTVTLDSCSKCNLVFDTAISSCEIVNCNSMQIQTIGICPTFTIDKTDSCLFYLSAETMDLTTFVTSKSSEMNVSFPDENGEMKEVAIPEQFKHKLLNGSITSQVSDLYH